MAVAMSEEDTGSSENAGTSMSEEDTENSENAGISSSSQNKPLITLNAFGLPVGDHSHKLATRCGELVRTHVPISIKDWRAVPKSKKEEIWTLLQEEFIVPQPYKDKCLKNMSEMFRKYKTKLRIKYLDPHSTDKERLNHRPPRVGPEEWEAFVAHNSDPKTVKQRKTNAKVRKNLNIYHTSGRHGHARLEEKMKRQRKDNDPPITRAAVWIQAHTRKDGSIPSSVSSPMEKVKELLLNQGEDNSHDILNDPLTQVFGIDMRGRVRGVGNVSRTQIVGSAAALEQLALSERKIEEQTTSIKNLESRMEYAIIELENLKQLIKQHLAPGSQSRALVEPETSESTASLSVSNTSGNDQPSMRWQQCKLLSWRKQVVAYGTAYIGNEPQMLLGKALSKDVYKVVVDFVDNGDVELPEPDGYHSTLGEVRKGSCVAWPRNFTRLID